MAHSCWGPAGNLYVRLAYPHSLSSEQHYSRSNHTNHPGTFITQILLQWIIRSCIIVPSQYHYSNS